MENNSESTVVTESAEPAAFPLETVEQKVVKALESAKREEQLKGLVLKSKEITTITNSAGYQECHSKRVALKEERIAIAKIGKAARDEANKFSKAIIAEEARLINIIEPEESRLQAIQDAYDAEREAKKKLALELERARVAACQAFIDGIKEIPLRCYGKNSVDINNAITETEGIEVKDDMLEFKPLAEAAKADVINRLKYLFNSTVSIEEEESRKRAELERQRVEAERLKAEAEKLAEARRIEQELAEQALDIQREAIKAQAEEAARAAEAIRQAQESARLELEERRRKFEQERDEEIARIARERAAIEANEKAKKKADIEAEEKFKRNQQELFEEEKRKAEQAKEESERLTALEAERAEAVKLSGKMVEVSTSGVSTSVNNGTNSVTINNKDIVNEAMDELKSFVLKYAHIDELSDILDDINHYVDLHRAGNL